VINLCKYDERHRFITIRSTQLAIADVTLKLAIDAIDVDTLVVLHKQPILSTCNNCRRAKQLTGALQT